MSAGDVEIDLSAEWADGASIVETNTSKRGLRGVLDKLDLVLFGGSKPSTSKKSAGLPSWAPWAAGGALVLLIARKKKRG